MVCGMEQQSPMKYKVQIKPSRENGSKWLTLAICDTKEHAAFVLRGLLQDRQDRIGQIIPAR